jgi:signal transduction histidine kinase/CheY-like chemotaxis protein/HAMP domain-containing protein
MAVEVEGRSLTGEFFRTAKTVNAMVEQLSTFTSEVIRVAREVGTDGKLGGQARVKGVGGAWKDLTDNVNFMAASLTNQVRAIAEVATAVTKGDLSRSVTVDAAGEVAVLKDNINEMIRNLRETTVKSTEQDWLKTNLARFTRLLQGQRDLTAVSRLILSELAPLAAIQHGVFYINDSPEGDPELRLLASYAFNIRRHPPSKILPGEGLVGQAAFERQRILLTEIPRDYVMVTSALGEASPVNIVVLPVLFEGQVKAVLELASLQRFSEIHLTFLDQLAEVIGVMLNTITATMRTEELLNQSQSLASELQTRQTELTETNTQLQQQARSLQESEERLRNQQEELQQTNEELEEKAMLLFQQNSEVANKNREIEKARRSLEEKAEQLALTSKYKSEFLANMSHELRTPLNSMLVLSKLLSENEAGNLSPKQVEFAETIHSSGDDLLALINEILDLSRIESGTMQIETGRVLIAELRDFVEKSFGPVAHFQGLNFAVDVRRGSPKVIHTDQQRLEQILKNLLSNAFKFTHQGSVTLRIQSASSGWNPEHPVLSRARAVIAFSVIDTGIGVARDKHKVIFEAFQQADGTTNRRYGGTGLGLSISREISKLLDGEIRVSSAPGEGSTFTLYLPVKPVRRGLKAPRAPTARVPSVSVGGHPGRFPIENSADTAPFESTIADHREDIGDGDHVLTVVEPKLATTQSILEGDQKIDPLLAGKKILIIDDDVRNIFSMTSLLERHHIDVAYAENGREGIRILKSTPDISAVIVDIMMPEMDGYETMRRIRKIRKFNSLPIIALTAKAMKGDREKCIEAGASDYVSKPANTDRLLSLLRVFLAP